MDATAQPETISDLDAIEEVATQTGIRVNEGSRAHGSRFGWAISPNIERAKVSRERPKPAPPRSPRAPAPVADPPPAIAAASLKAGDVLGEARNSDDMLEIWRAAKAKIGLSNKDFDELANLGDGHVDKLLGPTGAKGFGPKAFTAVNWTMALKWVCVVDADQLAVVEHYWRDRQRQVGHVRESSRVSKQILARAKPIILKEIGEKLAAALGDDVAQILVGMKPETATPASSGADCENPRACSRASDRCARHNRSTIIFRR